VAAGHAPEESIRVSLSRLEKLLNSVGELVILQSVLREQSQGFNPHLLRKTVHQMGKVTKEVQDISMSLRMVPLRQTFQKMQRIVRDTGNLLGKKVMLSTAGDDTELDKTVLEHISDPLVHLIRNACDHGIESPEKRIAAGKTETGFVALRAYHESGKLVIEVKDDGGGIDGERLQQKAVEKGILKPGARLTPQESIQLIFHPGFSTKAQVTEVSGRGVGMDVVKTNIEALQGEVLVETELGKGTTFKVILPLTLAIIDGMVVRNGSCRFVIPLSHVHETLRPTSKEVHSATGLGEVLMLRGENLPLYRLSQLLGQKRSQQDEAREQIAMVIRYTGQPFAVMVDDVLGQQQVVIKEVGAEIQSLQWMSGSAILGDGKPAIILEMNELVKPAKRGAA
jgi:two-component system chemotaxis sensor kinase CheA